MNCKAKIEELKQKGVFSDEQAKRLSRSFEKSDTGRTLHRKHKHLLEIVGTVLLGAALLYIFVSVGIGDDTEGVENVSRTLNAPAVSGVTAKSSFVLLLVILSVVLYGALYLYAQDRFKMFWRMAEKTAVLKEMIHNTEVMKNELTQTLERLLKEEREPEMAIFSKSIRADVMETLSEIERELLDQKEMLYAIEEKCRLRKDIFPDNLAKLAGELPSCTEEESICKKATE